MIILKVVPLYPKAIEVCCDAPVNSFFVSSLQAAGLALGTGSIQSKGSSLSFSTERKRM